jgi:hypothetical protein
MKKFVPPLFGIALTSKAYCCIAVVFLAGCTSTQVRWDAVKMRQDVMV